eukprot:NODE_2440_length_539_cov_600.722449_g1937_i0.p2 GENE.NODE_2440_length_539_cov_600.722449_g1937_i0~~NODE_2440_length_539_cov_600.722449_g1937_i0.p2  ORF type:complete len:138 (+),score=34.36 NODE_2440_length_539_cov_600.722449_g1937_i0:1-414(+)
MDGKYFGRQIVQAAAPTTTFAQPAWGASVVRQLPAAAPIAPATWGSSIAQPTATTASFAQPAWGASVAQSSPLALPSSGAFQPAALPASYFGASSSAAAYDAADGVMDGKFFGRQIVQQAPATATWGTSVAAPAWGF